MAGGQQPQENDVPVYLFTGFLEAGKTKFIQETLEDKRFNSGEKTMLLLCEEGEEEYDISAMPCQEIYIRTIEEPEELNPAHLQELLKECGATRVVLEYNGMWPMDILRNLKLPKEWGLYQSIHVIDGTTFEMYLNNMQSMIIDQVSEADMVLFNRCTPDMPLAGWKRSIRAANRMCEVVFEDERGEELPPVGESLGKIARVDGSSANKLLCETSFTIACDVNNPFYGSRGAAAVYAPQKGASPDEVDFLEKGMIHYAQVIKETRQMDISEIPGAGAAGGLGGGVLPFLNAELQSGIDIVLDMLRFRETIQGADLIFTGEGKLDKQTGMGKALGGILRYAKEEAVPVIAIGGCVEACEILNEMGFASIFSIQTAPVSLQEAMDRDFALKNIRQVVTQIMRTIQIGTHG